MRFLLVGNCFGRGGIQTHLYWMARLLHEDGHVVFMLPTQPRQADDDRQDELAQWGVISAGSPNGAATRADKIRQLPKMAAFVRQCRPDVYFVIGAGWVGMALRPLVAASSRAIFFEVMSGNWYTWRLDPRVMVRFCFNEVVGQSPRVSAAFGRAFSWGKRPKYLPAIPEPLERLAQIPPATQHRVPFGRAKAALFSRLDPTKRALWLVRQWHQLRHCIAELHIHGSGPEEEPIRQLTKTESLAGRVFCHGRYPDGQAYVDLLNSYDLTLLPTQGNEGAPLVLLESMACGVPFVATGIGGIPDYGRGNPDCAMATLRPERFVDTVRTMAERLDRGEIDQQRLQRYYKTNFSHAILRQTWLRFLTTADRSPFRWPQAVPIR
jgi:glycosyltransferase involved in cell wall biosynthesis